MANTFNYRDHQEKVQFAQISIKHLWTEYILDFHLKFSATSSYFNSKNSCRALAFFSLLPAHLYNLRHHSWNVPRNTPEWIIQNKIYLINCSSSSHTGFVQLPFFCYTFPQLICFFLLLSFSLRKHMKYLCWFFNLILSHKKRVWDKRNMSLGATITFSRMPEKNVSTKRYLSF